MVKVIVDGIPFEDAIDWDKISPELEVEETLNDSDKTISVPAGEEWKILWLHIEFSTTVDTGNREIVVIFRDDSDDAVYTMKSGFNQPASESIFYEFLPDTAWNVSDPGTTGAVVKVLPPDSILPAGYDIRVYDEAGVQATADDLIIQLMVKKRKVSGL